MKRSRRAPAPRRPLLAVEQLEDRAVPATFSFAGFTFEQNNTPDVRSFLAPGTYNGAIVTAAPTTATGTVTGFPNSTSGFNRSLAMGTLIDATNPPRALNLPAGNDGTTARSGILLSWSDGKGMVNAAGDDLLIYEIGFPNAPEAFMTQVHNATTGQWSNWYYEPADSFELFGSGGDGAFATSIGLANLGIPADHIIDAIRIVNMTNEDRMVNSSGTGQVIPEDNGATSTFLPNPGPLSSSTSYGTTTLDPSPLYVAAFHPLTVLPRPAPAFANHFSVGADEGANGHVKVFNSDGSLRFSFIAFEGFNGGVRVATGDVNGDGVDDIAVGAGFGAGNGHIKVFDGETGALIYSFFSFEAFLGGVDVAIGDVNGDGLGDLIVGSGPGGGHVKVFSLASGAPAEVASFFAYPDFTGGVTVTAGDINGDGRAEIITGTATGAAHVKAFSFTPSGAISEVASFLAYSGFAGGIDVAAADLRNNDGRAELLVSPLSRGAGEQVLLFSLSAAPTVIGSFTPSFPGAERGLRLATGDVDNDGDDDIIIAGGPGRGAKVKAFDALSFAELRDFTAFDAFQGGVFVG